MINGRTIDVFLVEDSEVTRAGLKVRRDAADCGKQRQSTF